MYCIYCGKEIPEGTTCSCRSGAPEQPVYSQPAYNAYSNNVYQDGTVHTPVTEVIQTPVHTAVKKVMGSPIGLIIAILLSSQLVLEIAAGITGNGIFTVNILLILAVIATWVSYAAGRNSQTTSTAGLTINSGLLITQIVFSSIAFVFLTFVIIFMVFFRSVLWDMLPSSTQYYWDIYYNMSDLPVFVFWIVEAVFVCAFLFALFYFISLRHNIKEMRYAVNGQKDVRGIGMFPIIIMFIMGGCTVLSNLSTFNQRFNANLILSNLFNNFDINFNLFTTLSGLVGGAIYVMAGIYLLMARKAIKNLK